MSETTYLNRRAHVLSNEHLEVVVMVEGGHIAAIRDKATGVNPLWTPPWKTMEPSQYDEAKHPEYGQNAESKLLSGLLGHNVCVDLFGGPSEDEAAAGMTVHGEASVNEYEIVVEGDTLRQKTVLERSQLEFERTIRLEAGTRRLDIRETVRNTGAFDRPIAWTQHVTLGPPFLERGKTEFRASATKSKVIENDFTDGKGYMKIGAEFLWPEVPCEGGGHVDMQVFIDREVSGAFSTHLMDPMRDFAYFTAWSPAHGLGLCYLWRQSDFPWLGIWEENHSRETAPWNGETLTRGMEFGVSPFPEPRRAMIDRGKMFGVPGYRWVPAGQTVSASYAAVLAPATSVEQMVP